MIVTIQLQNDLLPPTRVPDALVEIYDTIGVFQTSGTTDDEGEVQFTLAEGSWDVFIFKQGLSILPSQPQRIVVSSTLPNTFLVSGHERTLPESTDPMFCRVSGYFKGASGETIRTARLALELLSDFTAYYGIIVPPQWRFSVSADDEGYVEFDLLRGMTYEAYYSLVETLGGVTPGKMTLMVPDQPAINLQDLLYPFPVEVTFDPTSISLDVGDTDDSIEVTTILSDGSDPVRSVPWASVQLTNTDEAVVSAEITTGGKLYLTAKAAGTAVIGVERSISENVHIQPIPDFTSNTVTVTVS
jgi:hypothetical protein